MYISKIAEDILAERLLSYGAVTFYKDAPLRLKSGLVTPIYVDNRKLTAWPDAWHDVIETMASRIDQLKLDFDVVAIRQDLRQQEPCRRRRRAGQARPHH